MPTRKKNTAQVDEQPFDFEKNLTTLEQLVETMEEGDLPLEESLKKFEQGIQLIRRCQSALSEAEQRVEILTQQGLQPFEAA
jgi:exodeoxyribonuclease VII small subunit